MWVFAQRVKLYLKLPLCELVTSVVHVLQSLTIHCEVDFLRLSKCATMSIGLAQLTGLAGGEVVSRPTQGARGVGN